MEARENLLKLIDASNLEDIRKYLWEIFTKCMSENEVKFYEDYLKENPGDIETLTEVIERKLWALFTKDRKCVKDVIDFEIEILRKKQN